MRYIRQPGPVEPERHFISLTDAVPISIELESGQCVLPALAAALAKLGAMSAYLSVQDANVRQLEFVMPAPSPDDDHTAWWSETHDLAGSGRIEEAGLVFGWRDGGPFIHCHGSWTNEMGKQFAGHMLPDRCIIKDTATFTGWMFPDARFEGQFDPETNFTLFQPNGAAADPAANAALVRLRPNVEIGQELAKICKKLGWAKAEIHGLGSLIGASFDNGDTMESYATEFLVRQGLINLKGPQSGANIDILIVGLDGEIMHGPLLRDGNAVLMTCELVLLRSA
ncbi:hypothetical protein [Pararhizobium sp. IMCC21322]|uniref:hypothetical protein n=1 Tax=Pararhizobium sp. IMCC21322 TaxID=3067903 RepID=UPI00274059D5|nr:hypothetical protein [Pararhizobium sp. IMCC21322]